MGIERIFKGVDAVVARAVGAGGSAHERDSHMAVVDVVAVFAIVDDAAAVSAFRKVSPLVSSNLVTGQVISGVPVGRAFCCAVSDIVSCVGVDNRNVEARLKDLVAFVPVNGCVKNNGFAVLIEDDILRNL